MYIQTLASELYAESSMRRHTTHKQKFSFTSKFTLTITIAYTYMHGELAKKTPAAHKFAEIILRNLVTNVELSNFVRKGVERQILPLRPKKTHARTHIDTHTHTHIHTYTHTQNKNTLKHKQRSTHTNTHTNKTRTQTQTQDTNTYAQTHEYRHEQRRSDNLRKIDWARWQILQMVSITGVFVYFPRFSALRARGGEAQHAEAAAHHRVGTNPSWQKNEGPMIGYSINTK